MQTALTIAGSDSSGGAGIQADLKVFTVLGVYGMSALTAITAQNTTGVTDAFELPPALIRAQIDAVAADIPVHAVKSGMLSSVAIIETVADAIRAHSLTPYVCDPVMHAKSGAKLLRDDAVGALRAKLIPLATVVTPNRREAALLAGVDVPEVADVEGGRNLARRIVDQGARAVVVKGFVVGDTVVDLLYDGQAITELAGKRHPDRRNHGSGCAFAAAITAGLANRLPLADAIGQAKQLVAIAIQDAVGHGKGVKPVNILAHAADVANPRG
jgi:hydroxymethylpyrimidine/phosphomethylpyrimidine kinase